MFSSLWNGYSISRLMLGTVQFGMSYGVANRSGQPSYEDVVQIISQAFDGGVNCLDTAAAYGTSEEVVGRALHELGISDRLMVVTKIRALTPSELADRRLAESAIEASVSESRRRLKLDCLPVVLFHREPDAVYLDVLTRLQARGWLQQCGVSCDNVPGNADRFVESQVATALQIPGNVLDHRHRESGIFEKAAGHGVAVFIRSVYLQGLLIMPEDSIPEPLRDVIPARRALQKIATSSGMQLPELALRFMLSQPGVTSVLTGVETVSQVNENLAIFSRGPLSPDILSAIDLAAIELSDRILSPILWSR